MIRVMLMLTILSGLPACTENKRTFSIGNEHYVIPPNYLVTSESLLPISDFDKNVEMIGLTFNGDKDFSKFLGADAWLPNSSITALFLYPEGTALTGISPQLDNYIRFTIQGGSLIEFNDSYRLFNGDTRTRWKSFPKKQTSFEGNEGKTKWIADCVPMGGMKGVENSRLSIDIPTSCRVNIMHRNNVISITTSENNLIYNADIIINAVLRKIDSWRVK